MGRIRYSLDQTFSGLGEEQAYISIDTQRSDDFESLLRRVIGTVATINFRHLLRETNSLLNLRLLVRALIAASLYPGVQPSASRIIFRTLWLVKTIQSELSQDTRYGCYTTTPTTTTLTFLSDNCTLLKNLEFTSHRALILSHIFQEFVIPLEAEKLANRLSEALCILYSGGERQNELQKWKEDKGLLKDIFKKALKLKARATVSEGYFEAVLYAMGTPVEQESMEVEECGRVSPDLPAVVQLCVLPSLRVFPCETTIIPPNNFVQRGRSARDIHDGHRTLISGLATKARTKMVC